MRDTTARNGEMKRKRIDKIKTFQAGKYLRLSVDDGDRRESESIGSQRKMLENFVKQKEDIVLIREYVDDGYTGTNFERPGFQRLLEDVEKGVINCVIVKDLSRFGRNHIDTEIYVTRHFKEYGVRFIAVSDNFDTLKDGYDIMFSIRNIFNEHYARDISRKIHGTFRARQTAGDFMGAFACYGYVKSAKDKHKLEIDPEAAAIVKRIYEMYLEGAGQSRIVSILNTEGIPCPSEYRRQHGSNYINTNMKRAEAYWVTSTVNIILKNRIYVGDMVQGTTRREMHSKPIKLDQDEWIIVKNTHPAIIDREDWEKVQHLLSIRRSDVDYSRKENIFAGITICGDCGYTMVRKQIVKGRQYLVCGSYRRSGHTHCSSHSIRIELLQKIILDDLNTIIRNIKNIRGLLDEAKEKNTTLRSSVEIYEKERESIEKSLSRTNKLLKKTFELYALGEITADEYTSFRSQYLEQEKQLKERLRMLEEKIEKKEEYNEFESSWIAYLIEYGEIKELTREIIQETIKSIVIYEDKKIEITYLFGEEYDRLMQAKISS